VDLVHHINLAGHVRAEAPRCCDAGLAVREGAGNSRCRSAASNAGEFVSRDLDLWAYQRGVTLDFSRPGKPTDNAFIESFNGKFRAECLNAHWFMSLDDARRKCEARRRDYNEERPHSAIGNKAPIELIDRSVAHGPP
jgi:putative transposase